MTNDEKDFTEKNKLAATRVMGWTVVKSPCSARNEPPKHYDTGGGTWKARPISSFKPCTSIADSWMLVEKMEKDGRYLNLHYGPGEECDESFVMVEITNPLVREYADTAPLAITKAAILLHARVIGGHMSTHCEKERQRIRQEIDDRIKTLKFSYNGKVFIGETTYRGCYIKRFGLTIQALNQSIKCAMWSTLHAYKRSFDVRADPSLGVEVGSSPCVESKLREI